MALLRIIGLFGECTREMQCIAVIQQPKSQQKMFSILECVYTRVWEFVRVCVWDCVWVRDHLCECVCSVTLRQILSPHRRLCPSFQRVFAQIDRP